MAQFELDLVSPIPGIRSSRGEDGLRELEMAQFNQSAKALNGG